MFDQAVEIISQLLKELDIHLTSDNLLNQVDAIWIKQLKQSNTIERDRTSNQVHIAITGKSLDLFPYIENYQYMLANSDEVDNSFKRRFLMKIPILLNKDNLNYLRRSNTFDQDIQCFTTYAKTREDRNQGELCSRFDSSEFVNFRHMLNTDDFLVFLKLKADVNYLVLGIKEEDGAVFSGLMRQGTYVGFPPFNPSRDQSTVVDFEENTLFEQSTYSYSAGGQAGGNLILYGAPGTGKSFEINKRFPHNRVRITFHPEYTYYDFVGSYKPTPLYRAVEESSQLYTYAGKPSSVGESIIDYQFVPGPFTNALVKALSDKSTMVTLVIEELNRANAPAVFGDIFQLLDRDSTGKSEYSIKPNLELHSYLKRQIPDLSEEIYIPANMNIVATMNGADQGVHILDSAFKRRWNFEYMPIKLQGIEHEDEKVSYNGQSIPWSTFIGTINDNLNQLGIPEDRLVGPYFMKPGEPSTKQLVASKLLIYLWDDVLRHHRAKCFRTDIKTFAELNEKFLNGKEIFQFSFNVEKLIGEPTQEDANIISGDKNE